MQANNHFAKLSGVDQVWWTEHNLMWHQDTVKKCNFTGSYVDIADTIILPVHANSDSEPGKFIPETNGGSETTTAASTGFSMNYTSVSGDSAFYYFSYKPRGTTGVLKGEKKFNKPLTCHPHFVFQLTPGILDANRRFDVTVYLSYHYHDSLYASQKIVYNFVNQNVQYSKNLIDSFTTLINLPVINQQNNFVDLNLADDASLLPEGIDNTITDFEFNISSNAGNNITADIGNIKIRTYDLSDSVNISEFRNLAVTNTQVYNLPNLVNIEFTPNNLNFHISGLYDDQYLAWRQFSNVSLSSYDLDSFSLNIHQLNGILCICHPFGMDWFPLATAQQQDHWVDSLYSKILSFNAYSAEMIEVGYYARAHADIFHHLKLWDRLLSKGFALYGSGGGDSHGGKWNGLNSSCNYVWATDSTPAQIIHAIKGGRFFIASPLQWKREFNFTVGEFSMGDHAPFDSADRYLKVSLDSFPMNASYKIIQGIINPAADSINYILDNAAFNPADSVLIDISQPCFIRVVVYDQNNDPLIISNPIFFNGAAVGSADSKTANFNFTIIPNPAKGEFAIRIHAERRVSLTMTIFDFAGNVIDQQNLSACEKPVNEMFYPGCSLKKGSYLIKLYNGENSVTKKLLIE